MLAQHKSREDCWQSYNGKVYNITPFLKYHPGGAGELMRAAGRDGEPLFIAHIALLTTLHRLLGTELHSQFSFSFLLALPFGCEMRHAKVTTNRV